jgi:pilus assembly protein FimV
MLAGYRKIFAMVSLLVGCFHAGNVLAVGLGDLEVNSTLSEPLDATVQLLGLDGLNENQILASLGTTDDFDRANMERVALIDNILVEVIVFDTEVGLLLLTSDQPVEEPFLNLVIGLRWPNGRLLRDYTALIDLPLFISNQPEAIPVDIPEAPAPVRDEPEPAQPIQEAPVQQERSLSTAETTGSEPESDLSASNDAEDETPAPVVEEEIAEEIVEGIVEEVEEEIAEELVAEDNVDESVLIQSGDTLYDIAATNRPDTSVSVEQTMLAIQRNNPDAFIDNDINRIRVGQIIRIPSIQDIASIDQTQALNQIALQNQASTTQPLALSDNDPAGSQQGTDELTILSGDEGSDSLSGDSDLAETIAALENQLAISEENLDRARLENAELMARFADLEDQIDILQNIIAMQDERLAQLQANLAAEPPEAEEPVAAQPQQVANISQTDDSLMGQLSSVFENTLVLVASLVGLILLVVGFLVWRRQAAQSEMDEFDLGGAAVASGPEAFEAEEPDGASAGFLAAVRSRFNEEEDEDTVDDYDDEDEEGGLLAKLKGIFSRSSDEDDDFDDDVYEEDDELESEDSVSEELDGLEEDEDSEEALAFDSKEDDFDDDHIVEEASEELNEELGEESDEELDQGSDEEVIEDADDDLAEEIAEDSDEELVDEIAEELEDASDDDVGFDIDENDDEAATATATADEPEEQAPEDVESFDFNAEEPAAIDEPVQEVSTPDAEVESFDFDVGSVSSFEEETGESSVENEDSPDDDVVEIDDGEKISFGTQSNDEDPLAAALNEIDAEADQEPDSENDDDSPNESSENEDDLDLGNIDIDDSLFEASESDEIAEPITDRDESSTKLDLAVAYEAMGDIEGAREILNEVIDEGNDEQVTEAKKLQEKWEQS